MLKKTKQEKFLNFILTKWKFTNNIEVKEIVTYHKMVVNRKFLCDFV